MLAGLERAAQRVRGLARAVGGQMAAERAARAQEADRQRQEREQAAERERQDLARVEAARRAEVERAEAARLAEQERVAAELRRKEAEQAQRLARLRAERDQAAVTAALADLAAAASGTANVLYPMREALRARATVGEVCDTLRQVWGVHRPADRL